MNHSAASSESTEFAQDRTRKLKDFPGLPPSGGETK